MLRYFPDVGAGLSRDGDDSPMNDDPGSSDAAFDAAITAQVQKTHESREASTPDDVTSVEESNKPDKTDPSGPFSLRETFGGPDDPTSDRSIESGLSTSAERAAAASRAAREREPDPYRFEEFRDPETGKTDLAARARALGHGEGTARLHEQEALKDRVLDGERQELQAARDSALLDAADEQLTMYGEDPDIVFASVIQNRNTGMMSKAAFERFVEYLATPVENGGYGEDPEYIAELHMRANQHLLALSDQRAAEQQSVDLMQRGIDMAEGQDYALGGFALAKEIKTTEELDARLAAAQRALQAQHPGADFWAIENPEHFAAALNYYDSLAQESESAARQQVFKEQNWGASSAPTTNTQDGIERWSPLTGEFEKMNTIPIAPARVDPQKVERRMQQNARGSNIARFKAEMREPDSKRADIEDLFSEVRSKDKVWVAQQAAMRANYR